MSSAPSSSSLWNLSPIVPQLCATPSRLPSCQKPQQSQAVTTTATVSAKAVKQVVPRQAWRPKTSGGTFNLCARKSGRHELLFKKEYTNYIWLAVQMTRCTLEIPIGLASGQRPVASDANGFASSSCREWLNYVTQSQCQRRDREWGRDWVRAQQGSCLQNDYYVEPWIRWSVEWVEVSRKRLKTTAVCVFYICSPCNSLSNCICWLTLSRLWTCMHE